MNPAPMIRPYSPADAEVWNRFVQGAANATFLHDRGFMDYHADRFVDHSLIIEDNDKIIALLPASQAGDTLVSHGGLTYGGLLVPPRLPAATIVGIIEALQTYLAGQGLRSLIYKPSPHIFHTQPSEADLYALINAGARQVRADLGTAIPLQRRQPFSGGRKDGIRKARKAGLVAREAYDFARFWGILTEVLGSRHDAAPTHSLDEMTLLAERFPDQIRLFGTFDGDSMLAGMLLFDCGRTVHAQYIAAAPEGRNSGALDLLVHHLLAEVFAKRDWFSFGISTTNAGRELNVGLSRQKEMFGGHSVMFSQYQWDIA
ncbi:GNAT family N-acetyltransferase [Pseudophaeobacter sp.]|uniref:GNAT family N-acetyltransferase n=1 Tax=Pseudophaeobacter sp. TaxID=1971739 RepID=UPI003A97E964